MTADNRPYCVCLSGLIGLNCATDQSWCSKEFRSYCLELVIYDVNRESHFSALVQKSEGVFAVKIVQCLNFNIWIL
jgi:hypothetical protein